MKVIEEIVSILKEDIHILLEKTGQYHEFINNEITCDSCSCIITYENISAIEPYVNSKNERKLRFHCNSNTCLVNFKIN